QVKDATVRDPLCHEGEQYLMMDMVKRTLDIPFDDPVVFVAVVDVAVQEGNAIHRSASGPKAVGAVEEVTLPDGFQHHLQQHLYHSVLESGDADGTCFAIGLGDEA